MLTSFHALLQMCEDQKDKLKQDISADFEKFMFKGPKLQDLNQFRKLVEGGDSHAVKSQVWSNPRFIVSAVDTPTILHVIFCLHVIFEMLYGYISKIYYHQSSINAHFVIQ